MTLLDKRAIPQRNTQGRGHLATSAAGIVSNRRLSRYAVALSALLGLFIVRVLAQALVAVGYGAFLPPWEEWFSGLVRWEPFS